MLSVNLNLCLFSFFHVLELQVHRTDRALEMSM